MLISRRAMLAGAAALTTAGAVTGASAQTKPTIRVANLEIGPYVSIAYVTKLAEKHGINVKITNFRRGLEAANALKAGEVDIATGGVEAAISAIGGGSPAVIISSFATGGIGWVAKPGSNIKTYKDLKGKKFAVIRGLHELVMRVAFEQNGLTMSTEAGKADVQVLFIPSPPALLTAMKGGQVDAMSAPEPFPSRAVGDKLAEPMLLPYDTPLGNMPRAVFVSKSFLEKNRDATQRFVDALVEATKLFRDNPKLARDFAVNEALKGAMSGEDWDLGAKNQEFDVSLTVPIVQAYVDYMHRYDMLKEKFSANDYTDLSMLEKAKAKAGW